MYTEDNMSVLMPPSSIALGNLPHLLQDISSKRISGLILMHILVNTKYKRCEIQSKKNYSLVEYYFANTSKITLCVHTHYVYVCVFPQNISSGELEGTLIISLNQQLDVSLSSMFFICLLINTHAHHHTRFDRSSLENSQFMYLLSHTKPLILKQLEH